MCAVDTPPGKNISIHALREEGDFHLNAVCCCFFPISIHALREEGDVRDYVRARACQYISIHALREEGDKFKYPKQPDLEISIHALREEGDIALAVTLGLADVFLSTPSARRATSFSPP